MSIQLVEPTEQADPQPRVPQLRVAMLGTRGLPATYGGVERAVEALSTELARRGHDVTVYGRSAYSDPTLQPDGVHHVVLPQVNTKHLEAVSHTFLAALHAIASRQFDVLHFHATGPALMSLLARISRRPSVATVQGLDYKREKWGPVATSVLRVAARAAATVPDETIVVSKELQRFVAEEYGARARYIPNGVDASDFATSKPIAGLESDRFILFVGRLVPEKQVDVLIEAFRRLDLDVDLAIAGPSSHSDDYVQRIHELAASDARVKLLGPRYGAEKAWLLRNAAVFVQPSTIEGLPIALLEAIACSRFTVVSDIPENVEAVTADGSTWGLVFPTTDVAALADTLKAAVEHPQRRELGIRAGDAITSEYDWSRIAAETERVYASAMQRRSRD